MKHNAEYFNCRYRIQWTTLHVLDGHAEEHVHDDEGDDEDEDGEEGVAGEGEHLRLRALLEDAVDGLVVGGRVVDLDVPVGGVVERVVLQLTGHHHQQLDGGGQERRLRKRWGPIQ